MLWREGPLRSLIPDRLLSWKPETLCDLWDHQFLMNPRVWHFLQFRCLEEEGGRGMTIKDITNLLWESSAMHKTTDSDLSLFSHNWDFFFFFYTEVLRHLCYFWGHIVLCLGDHATLTWRLDPSCNLGGSRKPQEISYTSFCVNCLCVFRSGLVLKLSMALGKGRHSSANMGRIFEVSERVMDFLPFSNNY